MIQRLLLTIFTVILITSAFNLFAGDSKFVIRLENPTKDILKHFPRDKFDIASYIPGEMLDLVVNEQEYSLIQMQGFKTKISQSSERFERNLNSRSNGKGYRTYQMMLEELRELERKYPNLCKLYKIGDSQGKLYYEAGLSQYADFNHEIWALKLSDNVLQEEDEPSVYFMGEHHAREPASLEVAMGILNKLIDGYKSNRQITNYINSTQIWFVPLVNPNGHKLVLDGTSRMWRKNIRDNNQDGIINGDDGVDPNRNYGFSWGDVGASNDWGSQTYHGPFAFSEPEIQAIKGLMESRHYVTGITYHSYSELVLYPFGYGSNVIAPDRDALRDLAIKLGESIPKLSGNGHYRPQASWQLYPCMGTTDDYSYGQHGTFSFTVELGTQFFPPFSTAERIVESNMQAAMILLDRVFYSTLTGNITDAVSGKAVDASVFIDGIDDTGEFRHPYVSDQRYGRFYRLLMPGDYDVKITRYGYKTVALPQVQIKNGEQTDLNVKLEPMANSSLTLQIIDDETMRPISGVDFSIEATPFSNLKSDGNGMVFLEEIVVGTYKIQASKMEYQKWIGEIEVSKQCSNDIVIRLKVEKPFFFENGFSGWNWQFSGSHNWQIDSQNAFWGDNSAQSGAIGGNSETVLSLSANLTTAGEISFYRKVSSESFYDKLVFMIDGEKIDQWSGELGWEKVSYQVSAGTHTFSWKYSKDGSVTSGEDKAWIDYIVLPVE